MEGSPELVLRTARLLLRPLELDDVEMLWPDIADPEIARHMAWQAHRDRSETATFLQAEVARRQAGRGITWAIMQEGAFRGIVSLIALLRTHRALTYDRVELAYWLGRSSRGQGFMTEAALRVMRYAFSELALHKIVVSHVAENKDSERLIRRLGFRYVGEQREDFQKNGEWQDHRLYELLAREFPGAPG